MKKRIIISGGGTGGHIFPAIAIANAIKEIDSTVEFLFVGAKGKIEMEKVPKAGYSIKGLWISGFHRKLTIQNLLFPIKLLHSLWKAYWIVKRFKPNAVVGVGGFASGPTLKVAGWQGIPTLIQEQNSYAGVTNKLLAKQVSNVCVAYDKMDKFFPSEKIIKTGNPVRQEVAQITGKKEVAQQHFFGKLTTDKVIFIMGGSLGARSLNEALSHSYDLLKERSDVQVIWQAGKLYIEEFSKTKTAQLPNVHITAFIDKMDYAYALADVVISRAGALSISELCLVGKPTILVPSPNVAEDHQTKNALAIVEKQAGILVKDSEVKGTLIPKSFELIDNLPQQMSLSQNILKLGRPQAAKHIAKTVLNLCK